jgi:hypothetical protein
MDNHSPGAQPADKNSKPAPDKVEPESKKSSPDTKAEPDQRSSATPEKKAR